MSMIQKQKMIAERRILQKMKRAMGLTQAYLLRKVGL